MKDKIKSYIVQIQSMFGRGSGVLVKDNNEKYYIFTAKHNFKSTANQKVEEIEIEDIKEDIEFDEVKVISYHEIEVCDVIGLEDLSIDFVILVIDENSFEYLNTLPIEVSKNYDNSFNECIVSGYPKISTDAVYLDCKYETKNQEYEKKDDYKHTFKVSSIYPLNRSVVTEVDTISGISGGGIFVKGEDGEIYLVGIEIEYIDIHNLVCVDLVKLKDEINFKLIDEKLEYISEKITLKNSKSFEFKMVKVDLPDKSLYVSIYPVTFDEYDMFCEDTKRCKKYEPNDRGWGRGQRPVINVSLKNSKEYCKWLSKKNNKEYRLPSSKEWKNIAKLNYDFCNNSHKYMWYGSKDNTIEVDNPSIKPDILGLYNFYGNVDEWCENGVARGGSFRNTNINKKTKTRQKDSSERISFRVYRKI